jgi:hypothetical protein
MSSDRVGTNGLGGIPQPDENAHVLHHGKYVLYYPLGNGNDTLGVCRTRGTHWVWASMGCDICSGRRMTEYSGNGMGDMPKPNCAAILKDGVFYPRGDKEGGLASCSSCGTTVFDRDLCDTCQ